MGSPRGAAAKGVEYPPKASGGAPSPRVPNPRRMGAQGGGAPAHYGLVPLPTSAHGALRDGWSHPVDPRDPSGGPGTIPVTLNLPRWPKVHFLYIILHLRTILELLVTSGISSGTPNNFRVTTYSYLYNPSVTEPSVCRPYGFGRHVDMTETTLWSITNSGIWIPMLAPTCSR